MPAKRVGTRCATMMPWPSPRTFDNSCTHLSDTLGLVGVDDAAHGKRVGVMAAECAKNMGWTAHLDTMVRAATRPAAA